MEAPTLGKIFSKHLAFPAAGKARVSVDAFAERLSERHLTSVGIQNDPAAWVEHFFEVEQAGEAISREFRIVASLGEGPQSPVLELELAEQEFAIVESEDEIVVMSQEGSMVVQRTTELLQKLRAAELPSAERTSLNSAFRGSGERAYFVGRSGQIQTLDARAVAKVLATAPAPRVQPLVHISQARERLAPFVAASRVTETRVAVSQPPPATPRQAFAPASSSTRASVTAPAARPEPSVTQQSARRIAEFAKTEIRGGGPQVIVVERNGNVRDEHGPAARWWSRLASSLSQPAGTREAARLSAGATAVALGRQTWAVKAGGVTALVQRPAEAVSRRSNAEARRSELVKDVREIPSWLRRLIDERPRTTSSYWIDPTARRAKASARPAWIAEALEQAREVRARAHAEVARQSPSVQTHSSANVSTPTAGSAGANVNRPAATPSASRKTSVRVVAQSASYASVERALSSSSLVTATGDGRLPATVLRSVAFGLERSLSLGSGFFAPAAVRATITLGDRTESLQVDVLTRRDAPPHSRDDVSVLSAPFRDSSLRVGREIDRELEAVSLLSSPELVPPRPTSSIPLDDPFARIDSTPLSVMYPRGVRSQLGLPRSSGGGAVAVGMAIPSFVPSRGAEGVRSDSASSAGFHREVAPQVFASVDGTEDGSAAGLPSRGAARGYGLGRIGAPLGRVAGQSPSVANSPGSAVGPAATAQMSGRLVGALNRGVVARTPNDPVATPLPAGSPFSSSLAPVRARGGLSSFGNARGAFGSSALMATGGIGDSELRSSFGMDASAEFAAPTLGRSDADGPAAMTASAWLDWAMRNAGEARAKTAGEPIATSAPSDAAVSRMLGQPSSVRAPERSGDQSYFASEEAARSNVLRTPSMFIRFSSGHSGPRARREMAHEGPEIGLFAAPISVDGSFVESNPWRFPAGDSTLPRPKVAQPSAPARNFIEGRWSPAGGSRESVPVRLTPLFLQDVNARRAPDPVASAQRYSAEAESLSEEYVVPVPLWVQMAGDSPLLATQAPAEDTHATQRRTTRTAEQGRTTRAGDLPLLAIQAPAENGHPAQGWTTRAGTVIPQIHANSISAGGRIVGSAPLVSPAGVIAQGGATTAMVSLSRPGGDGFSLTGGPVASVTGGDVATNRMSASGLPAVQTRPTGVPENGLASRAPSAPELAVPSAGVGSDALTARFAESHGYFPSDLSRSSTAGRVAGNSPPSMQGSSSVGSSSSISAASGGAGGQPAAVANAPERTSYFPSDLRDARTAPRTPSSNTPESGGMMGASSTDSARTGNVGSYFPSELRRASRQGWGGTLRFRFPSAARWWPSAAAPAASASRDAETAGAGQRDLVKVQSSPLESDSPMGLVGFGAAGAGAAVLGATGSAGAAARFGGVAGATGAFANGSGTQAGGSRVAFASAGSPSRSASATDGGQIGPPASSGGTMSAPASLARGRKAESHSYFPSDVARSEADLNRPGASSSMVGSDATATALAPAPSRESDPAFVAVSPTGEARVLSAGKAAAAVAGRKTGGSGTAVDMTVVAAMTPQAPSLEDMATAGHERPHLKAKKEGGAAKGGGAAGKTDNMSLQGTVDSLAQRIYHRLKRRLASDRERFGG